MEIKDVFGATPKSVWEYLCENGQGLYVPAYQRHYSWDRGKIERLLEDACHGFSLLTDRDDAITFLGTIIAIHDTALVTVSPLVKGDVPSRVMTIIDGQQRLTTLLIINTVLHEEIRARSEVLREKVDPADVWLLEESMKVVGRLVKTYEENKDYGDGPFQFYPRMIRAYDDSWSRKKSKAIYTSPIGHYLHAYGQHGRSDPKTAFKYLPPEDATDPAKYRFLRDARAVISKLIKQIAKSNDKELELPNLPKMIGAIAFQNMLLKAEIPEQVKATLLAQSENAYKELLRLVLFANFVLDRVAVTIVTAKNEDYAFDMFESLNTTGEPLTAFETFKPRIIASEKLQEYETSKSREYVDSVESYLESFTRSAEKQDATSRLVVSFALAESGEKLSKRLSDQRRYLKDRFDAADTKGHGRDFVRHLSHVALFVQHTWPDEKGTKPLLFSAEEAATDDVLLCIDVLRSFNHAITLAPLVRFYSEIRRADAANRPKAVEAFGKATRAITAFSVLWRSSRRGTENIDAIYRSLMENGLESTGFKPLARCVKGEVSPPPDALALQTAFRDLLKARGGIAAKEDWVKLVSKIPAYSNQSNIARFLLLAAAHDSADDKANPGLTVAGKKGLLDLLNFKTWRDGQSQTVEHVAPQTKEQGWQDELYDDVETLDQLGNLTLLPGAHNSSLGNASWAKKRLLYRILSAATSDEADPLIEQAKHQGITLAESTADLVKGSQFLPLVKSLANVEGDWSLDLIQTRSTRLAELAWDRIAPWLGFAES